MSISSNNLIVKNLVEYGLSEKESKAYIALLELEVASVNEVARAARINRSSCYVVLESLQEKGLVSISGDVETRQYVASSPEILLQSAKDKAEKHKVIKDRIENMVPELKALHKDTKHKPVIKVFEGQEAVKQIYYDISALRPYPTAHKIRVYEDPATYIDLLPDFVKIDSQERKRRGIKMYAIFPKTRDSQKVIDQYTALGSKDAIIKIL